VRVGDKHIQMICKSKSIGLKSGTIDTLLTTELLRKGTKLLFRSDLKLKDNKNI